ncbi:fibronectin type III domain-containing protein [Patescibacteria group bacterium]|nr:fibronectin type III domain-containing protein [Patescibacteria group bacterium]
MINKIPKSLKISLILSGTMTLILLGLFYVSSSALAQTCVTHSSSPSCSITNTASCRNGVMNCSEGQGCYCTRSVWNGEFWERVPTPGRQIGENTFECDCSTTWDQFNIHITCCEAISPGVPQNLSAMAGNQQVVLSWIAPISDGGASITNYEIYRDEVLIKEIDNITNYTDTGLINDTIYYYKVAAKNIVGIGSKSAEISVSSKNFNYQSVGFQRYEVGGKFYIPESSCDIPRDSKPSFICTPYLIEFSGQNYSYGEQSNLINYTDLYETKEEAINATINSLETCLNNNDYIDKSAPEDWEWTNGGAWAKENQRWYDRGWIYDWMEDYLVWDWYRSSGIYGSLTTFSAPPLLPPSLLTCINKPVFDVVSNAKLWAHNSNSCIRNTDYTKVVGVARQIGYQKISPEYVHMRKIDYGCNWEFLIQSNRQISDVSVPTYKLITVAPSAPEINIEISDNKHGFDVFWESPEFTGGLPVSYRIYRSTDENFPDDSSTTIMTIGEGIFSYSDNKIKDPNLNTLYYKVVAINDKGPSDGVIVDTSDLIPIENYVENMTIKGYGFLAPPITYEVNLMSVAPADFYNAECKEFVYSKDLDSGDISLINGVCNITNAPIGNYKLHVKMFDVDGNIIEEAYLPSAFKITYKEPIDVNAYFSDVTLTDDRILGIEWIEGGDLYTGAIVKAVVNGIEQDCFNLSEYDDDNERFPGGQCKISEELMNATGGDMNKINIVVANDSFSPRISLSEAAANLETGTNFTGFECVSNVWTPTPLTVCEGQSFTQINYCGEARTTEIGTKLSIWSPKLSEKCGEFTQVDEIGCKDDQPAIGTIICSETEHKICGENNECIINPATCTKDWVKNNKCIPNNWECGLVTDPCDNVWSCNADQEGECNKVGYGCDEHTCRAGYSESPLTD